MRGQSLGSSSSANGLTRLKLTVNNLADRVRKLEHSRTVTVGKWRLTENGDGDLCATNTETGVSAIVAHRMSPDVGEDR